MSGCIINNEGKHQCRGKKKKRGKAASFIKTVGKLEVATAIK